MSDIKDIKLRPSQEKVLKKMKEFIQSNDRIFILKGYAGTGKTTLMRFLIEYLNERKRLYKLLSPTGRAAKILANYTGAKADTIHSLIYHYQSFNRNIEEESDLFGKDSKTNQLFLVFEPQQREFKDYKDEEELKEVIYIIDEASMVGDDIKRNVTQAMFGSGRLLYELLHYDSHPKSKYIFVGDPCQLPPVMESNSPALDSVYIRDTFNYAIQESQLTEIMRQKGDNSIISASTTIRKLWQQAPNSERVYDRAIIWGKLPLREYKDIYLVNDVKQMQEKYLQDVKQHGYNHSIFICRSNKDCVTISGNIREKLGFTKTIEKGDIFMVVQNQYTTGLMNGDMVEVIDVDNKIIRTPHNKFSTPLTFKSIKVRELFTKKEYTTLIIEETLISQNNNLDSHQQTNLFVDFIMRMKEKGITEKKKPQQFTDALRRDVYLNALRCSYGYAVTCHKAQGGEWNNVYIHLGARNFTKNPIKSTYQWIYTAITRAKEKVFMVDDFYIK